MGDPLGAGRWRARTPRKREGGGEGDSDEAHGAAILSEKVKPPGAIPAACC